MRQFVQSSRQKMISSSVRNWSHYTLLKNYSSVCAFLQFLKIPNWGLGEYNFSTRLLRPSIEIAEIKKFMTRLRVHPFKYFLTYSLTIQPPSLRITV